MFWTKDPREKVRTILMNMYGAVTSKTPWGLLSGKNTTEILKNFDG